MTVSKTSTVHVPIFQTGRLQVLCIGIDDFANSVGCVLVEHLHQALQLLIAG